MDLITVQLSFFQSISTLFIGFGAFILGTSFVKRSKLIDDLTVLAVGIVRFAALAYILYWLFEVYTVDPDSSLANRLSGPYWVAYLMYPICCGVIPQLLWVEKLRKHKAVRVIIAIQLLFIVYIERFAIWVASLHSDYLPVSWTMIYFDAFQLAMGVFIFSFVLGTAYLIKIRLVKSM